MCLACIFCPLISSWLKGKYFCLCVMNVKSHTHFPKLKLLYEGRPLALQDLTVLRLSLFLNTRNKQPFSIDQSEWSIHQCSSTTCYTLIAYLCAVFTLHLFNCLWGDEMLKTVIQGNQPTLNYKKSFKKKRPCWTDSRYTLLKLFPSAFNDTLTSTLCKNPICGLLTHWTAGMDSERLSNES